MIIARQKRKENIAEYILYMWHIEDTIRACEFDISIIEKHIISKFDTNDSTKQEMKEWYERLIEMMKSEQLISSGHTQISKSSERLLSDFHVELLENKDEKAYHTLYSHTTPFIDEFKQKNALNDMPSIAVCLQFMYGVWLLKIQQKALSTETNEAVEQIGKLLSVLAKKWKDNEVN